jgi:hypothetical protein
MNLTSIWSDPATVVTVLRTWALGLHKLPALPAETGCTTVETGCQIAGSGWKRVFLQVRAISTPALSLAGRTGCIGGGPPRTPCPGGQSRMALLSAFLQCAPTRTRSHRSAKCLAPSPILSPRKHATTGPHATNYPPRVPPSAPTGPQPRCPLTNPASRSRPITSGPRRCIGGPQGPRMCRPLGAESRNRRT